MDKQELRNKFITLKSMVQDYREELIRMKFDSVLTDKQVLEMLGIGTKTLRSYRTNGLLAYSKIGNKFFYRMSDINRMLDNARVESDYSETAYG